jgi:hypothetical protein
MGYGELPQTNRHGSWSGASGVAVLRYDGNPGIRLRTRQHGITVRSAGDAPLSAFDLDGLTAQIDRALHIEGGHLSIGRSGNVLYFDPRCTLSGYDCEPVKAACIACGLPVIDSRDVPFEIVFDLAVRGPLIAVSGPADESPWGAFSGASLAAVANVYRAAVAIVAHKDEWVPDKEQV